MTKVGFLGAPKIKIDGYEIIDLDLTQYFQKTTTIKDLLLGGINSYYYSNRILFAGYIDEMYRNKDSEYQRFEKDFIETFQDVDILIVGHFLQIHPETIQKHFKNTIKIMAFIDEPNSTYIRGIPYLWAYDAALYISPSYSESELMRSALHKWGCKNSYWMPLSLVEPPEFPAETNDDFFTNRHTDMVYIGKHYGDKINRLVELKKTFGKDFEIYGRYPFKGYGAMLRGLFGLPHLTQRVQSLSDLERKEKYFDSKISFNMHLSDKRECGNLRTYEAPMHGCMLMSNTAGENAHNLIFKSGIEAVYYENMDDAVEKIKYYLEHDSERIKIAKAGFKKVLQDYNPRKILSEMLLWASTVEKG